jgi:hypothetical protein
MHDGRTIRPNQVGEILPIILGLQLVPNVRFLQTMTFPETDFDLGGWRIERDHLAWPHPKIPCDYDLPWDCVHLETRLASSSSDPSSSVRADEKL